MIRKLSYAQIVKKCLKIQKKFWLAWQKFHDMITSKVRHTKVIEKHENLCRPLFLKYENITFSKFL